MTALRPRRLVLLLVAAAVGAAGSRTVQRLEVRGASMLPALEPGDRVLVVRTRRLRPGQVVAVRDPREPSRVVVKRAVARRPGGWQVEGDNAAHSTDSRVFGAVGPDLVVGRVFYRYHPAGHSGWVRPRR